MAQSGKILGAAAVLIGLAGCATRPLPEKPMAILGSFWQPNGPECDFTDSLRLSSGFSTSSYSAAPRRASMNTYGAGQVIPLARRDQHLCVVLIRWRSAEDETALSVVGFDVRPASPALVRITPKYIRLLESGLTGSPQGAAVTATIQIKDGDRTGTAVLAEPWVALTEGADPHGEPVLVPWDEAARGVSLSVVITEWKPGRRVRPDAVVHHNAAALTIIRERAEAAAIAP